MIAAIVCRASASAPTAGTAPSRGAARATCGARVRLIRLATATDEVSAARRSGSPRVPARRAASGSPAARRARTPRTLVERLTQRPACAQVGERGDDREQRGQRHEGERGRDPHDTQGHLDRHPARQQAEAESDRDAEGARGREHGEARRAQRGRARGRQRAARRRVSRGVRPSTTATGAISWNERAEPLRASSASGIRSGRLGNSTVASAAAMAVGRSPSAGAVPGRAAAVGWGSARPPSATTPRGSAPPSARRREAGPEPPPQRAHVDRCRGRHTACITAGTTAPCMIRLPGPMVSTTTAATKVGPAGATRPRGRTRRRER